MLGRWKFNKSDPSSVRVEVTQRDQFNNDDVSLATALVREALQNSSDAAVERTTPVKVSFRIKTLQSDESEMLRRVMGSLEQHLDACRLRLPSNVDGEIRVLCIEDYNTTGLTGSFEELDKENFDNFWRAVGESKKSGQQGGRWGLGKLVYSSASRIRSFFGLTMREDDDGPSMMGQAVLSNHNIGEEYYPAHGFWFDRKSSVPPALQLPVSDTDEIQKFEVLFGTKRGARCGLSLVIPFLVDGITEETILSAVIENYYFPILAGRLVVEVGRDMIDADTFIDIAHRTDNGASRVPLAFLKQVSDAIRLNNEPRMIALTGTERLASTDFPVEQIEQMKSAFATGELVRLCVAINLKPRSCPEAIGHYNLFLRACIDEEEPFLLFARGPITLPGERKYATGIAALGAMIADSGAAAEFLGDAENPAHTGWNERAEKLTSRWESPHGALRAIRHSLRDLYDMIADQREMEDANALIDFFWLADKSEAATGKQKRVRKPKVEVPPRETGIRINPKNGGFDIVAGPGAENWRFPRRIRIRIAYDIIGADPFKRFSPFDFDLRSSRDVVLDNNNGDTTIIRANALYFDVRDPDFRLEAAGFDTRRDLVVDARAL